MVAGKTGPLMEELYFINERKITMKNNYKRVNVWLKVAVFTVVLLFALAFADSELDLINWFDDVESYFGVALIFEAITIIIEFVIGSVKTIIDKIRARKEES